MDQTIESFGQELAHLNLSFDGLLEQFKKVEFIFNEMDGRY